jgi:hypothetical protein
MENIYFLYSGYIGVAMYGSRFAFAIGLTNDINTIALRSIDRLLLCSHDAGSMPSHSPALIHILTVYGVADRKANSLLLNLVESRSRFHSFGYLPVLEDNDFDKI